MGLLAKHRAQLQLASLSVLAAIHSHELSCSKIAGTPKAMVQMQAPQYKPVVPTCTQ